MNPPLLQFEGITKKFGSATALNQVDFSCSSGEIRAILGENGAGKSTLMKIISGVYRPTSGKFLVKGQPVDFRKPSDAMEHGLVCMFQELSLVPDISVKENILLGASYRKLGFLPNEGLSRARDILDSIDGADIQFNEKLGNLSLSQMQQVEIAKVLCKDPTLLIMDESTSALNVNITQKVFGLIREEKVKGVCVLFISHRFHEIEEIADTISVFRNGQHIDTFPNHSLPHEEIVSKMIGERLDHVFPPKREISEEQRSDTVLSVQHLNWQNQLKDISFTAFRGEIVGLGGLEGQGQNLLIQHLFGLLKQTSGTQTLNGHDLNISSPKAAKHNVAARVCLVPEERKNEGVILDLSIKDNVELAALGLKDVHHSFRQSIDTLLQRLELVYRSLEQSVAELSGGNQQKVSLTKWLVLSPHCLLLEDPTRGIDIKTKMHIYDLIRELADNGMCIILKSTDYEELINLCDTVHIFYEGKISASLVGADITAENIIANSLRL